MFQGGLRFGGGRPATAIAARAARGRDPHRGRAGRRRLAPVDGHPLRPVAQTRIPRRRRLRRADQEPGRHDLGAAQDRRPRRAAKAPPRRSWRCASTIRARASPICSTPIRRSNAGSPRWCSSPAATIRVRSRCRSRRPPGRAQDQRRADRADGPARRFAGPWGGEPAEPPARRQAVPAAASRRSSSAVQIRSGQAALGQPARLKRSLIPHRKAPLMRAADELVDDVHRGRAGSAI